MKEWNAKEIKELRHKLGMPQVRFKDLLGISLVYLSFLEIDKRKPSKTLRILLSRVEREFNEKGEVENV